MAMAPRSWVSASRTSASERWMSLEFFSAISHSSWTVTTVMSPLAWKHLTTSSREPSSPSVAPQARSTRFCAACSDVKLFPAHPER